MKTLLLSANYFPIRVISWERAVKMRFEETADVVAEYSEQISSPSVTWKIPAVVRERRAAKVKHAIRFSRANVYLRDGYRCQYCSERFEPKLLSYDHVVPRCQGGKTVWENIVTSCYGCNDRKGSRTLAEAGMKLLRKPVKPRTLPITPAFRLEPSRLPSVWQPYCQSIG